MRIRAALLAALAACPALAGRAQDKAPGQDDPVADFTLPDSGGKSHSLCDSKDARGVVLVFIGNECPMSNRYLPRLINLHKAYSARHVAFLAINPNAFETADAIAKHASEASLPFPVLLDPDQKVADALKVSIIPAAVLLDPGRRVRYRGRIDDNKSEDLVKNRFLRNALDALLGDKEIPVAESEPSGCQIQRKLAEAGDAAVTYADPVAKILNERCVACHRPGQVAPFSLTTHEQARRWSQNISRACQAGVMPPWKPVNEGMFRDERRLTKQELESLVNWAAAGAPLGDASKVPPPPKFAEGWALGEPDLVLEPEAEYEVDATGRDEFRAFSLDPKLTEDRYVTAVEVRPGNYRVVHHLMAFLDPRGDSAKLDAEDPKPGYSTRGTGLRIRTAGDLCGWVPGMQPTRLPPDTGYLLTKGCRIAMEVHYHKNGRREKDRTKLGLHFAKGPISKRMLSVVMVNRTFLLAAGMKRQAVHATSEVPVDVHALTIIPHMHWLGREFLARAVLPDKTEKTLIHIKDWDFNWHEAYHFKEPFALPRGTQLTVTGWFDNSAENPNNPNNPPRVVSFGEQTTDEMLVVYIAYTPDK